MYNKIIVVGNLGSDPEMRYVPSGSAVTSFSVATNRRYTTREGESRDETEWFRVSAWDRLAEQANQYLAKGRLVLVEGRFRSRMYQGNDGQMRASNEIVASEIRFLGGRDQAAGAGGGGGDFRSYGGGERPGSGGDFGEGAGYGGGSGFDDAAGGQSVDDIPF